MHYNKKDTSVLTTDLVDLLNDNVVKPEDFKYTSNITTLICFVPTNNVD